MLHGLQAGRRYVHGGLSQAWRQLGRPCAPYQQGPMGASRRPLCTQSTPFAGIEYGIKPSQNARPPPYIGGEEEDSDLHFVFLEGATGVGKANVTWKLEKLGYKAHVEGFIGFCEKHAQYSPTSAVMALKWSNRLLTVIEFAKEDAKNGLLKDGLVFFDRSFLSPVAYSRGLPVDGMMLEVMKEIRERNSASVVLCRSDPYAVTQRVSGRLFDAKNKEKEIREALGEDSEAYRMEVAERYDEMEKEGLFDAILDTSSSKLAVASLLHSLGVESSILEQE